VVLFVADGFESDCAVGLLEPLSDVVVTLPVTETSVEHTNLKTDILRQKSQKCGDQTENLKLGQSFVPLLWNTLRSYVSDRGAKKDLLVESPFRTKPEHQTISLLKKCNNEPLPVVYRVHPLHLPASENERKNGDYLLLQPYNVFVTRCCMPSVDAAFLNSRKGVLTCKLIRIPDPSDSEDSLSKRASKDDEFHRHDSSSVPSSKTTSVSVHVQLYVIEDIYMNLSSSSKEYLDKVTIYTKIGHDALLVPSVVRSVLGAQIGAKVTLEVLTTTARSLVSEIQITPLGNWVCM